MQKVGKHKTHSLLPAQLFDENKTFCSKGFYIRYCDEDVELNDIVIYRAEIPVENRFLDKTLKMEVELYFGDLGGLTEF